MMFPSQAGGLLLVLFVILLISIETYRSVSKVKPHNDDDDDDDDDGDGDHWDLPQCQHGEPYKFKWVNQYKQ